MGFYQHKTLIFFSSRQWYEKLQEVFIKATELFPTFTITPIFTIENWFYIFYILPDGYKEGTDESDEFDETLEYFEEFLEGYIRFLPLEGGVGPYITYLKVNFGELSNEKGFTSVQRMGAKDWV